MIIVLNAESDVNTASKKKKFEDLTIEDFTQKLTFTTVAAAHKILLFESKDTENGKAKYLKIKNGKPNEILTEEYWEDVSLVGNKNGILNTWT